MYNISFMRKGLYLTFLHGLLSFLTVETWLDIHEELPVRMNMHFFLQWWTPMNPKSQVGASKAHVQSKHGLFKQGEGRDNVEILKTDL